MAGDLWTGSLSRLRYAPIWAAPHRPLFLASFLCALYAVAWWPLATTMGVPPPIEPAILWHIHELQFGFAGAAIGGYLLTALPGWTGQAPIGGARLQLLVMSWVAARIAVLGATDLPESALLLAGCGYFGLLAAMLGWQIVAARAWGKLGFVAAVVLAAVLQAAFLLGVVADAAGSGTPIAQLALIGLALLIVTIAGRAIPAFIDNWARGTGRAQLTIIARPRRMRLAQALLIVAALGSALDRPDAAHGAMLGAALALIWAMRGWHVVGACRNPLLAALILGFAWVPIGLGLLGLAGIFPGLYPAADASHALSIGAVAGLIMAIAGRAAAHRVAGDLRAGAGFVVGFALVWLSALCRLAVPLAPAQGETVLLAAAGLWCLGWVVFIAGFRRALTGPVLRPVLSGRKHGVAPDSDPRGI